MEPDLTRRRDYRHWTTVTIRFSDEDSLGHINNAAYAVWLEAARVMFVREFLEGRTDLDTVLARLEIDFLAETRFPGEVEIGSRLLGIGTKSFRSGYGVFRGDTCLATSVCVNVFFDPLSRRSVAPPDTVRRLMEARLD